MDKPSRSSKPRPITATKAKKPTPSRQEEEEGDYQPRTSHSRSSTPKPKATPSTRSKKTLGESSSSARLASASSGPGTSDSVSGAGMETPAKKSKRKRQESVTPTGPGKAESGKANDREKTVHTDGGIGSATPRRLRSRVDGVVEKGKGALTGAVGKDGVFGDKKCWNVVYKQNGVKHVFGYEVGVQPILPPGTLVDYTFTEYSSSTEKSIPFTTWLITHLIAEAHSNVYGAEAVRMTIVKMPRREWELLVGLRRVDRKGEMEGGEGSAEGAGRGLGAAVANRKGKGKAKVVDFVDEEEVIELVKLEIVPGYSIALKMRLHYDKQPNFLQNDFDRCQSLFEERHADKELPLPVAFTAKARILRPPTAKKEDGHGTAVAAGAELQSWEVGMMASGTRMGICAQDLVDWSLKNIREIRMKRDVAKEGTPVDMEATKGERAKIMAVACHTVRPFLDFAKRLKVHHDAKFANAIIVQSDGKPTTIKLNDLGAWRKLVTKYTDEDAIVGTFGSCHVTVATRFVRKWLEDEGENLVKSGKWTREEVDREMGQAGFAMAKQPALEMDAWGLGTDILRGIMPARWVEDHLGVLERALMTIRAKIKNGTLTYSEFEELADIAKEAYTNIYIHRTYENIPGFDQSSAILLKALIRHPTGTGWLHAQCSPEQLDQYHVRIEDMIEVYTTGAGTPGLEEIVAEYKKESGEGVGGTGLSGFELARKLVGGDRAVRITPIKINGQPGSLLATKKKDILRLDVPMIFDEISRTISLVYPISNIYGQYSVDAQVRCKCVLPGCDFVADRYAKFVGFPPPRSDNDIDMAGLCRWSGEKGMEGHLGTELFQPECPYLRKHADEEFIARLLLGWRESVTKG